MHQLLRGRPELSRPAALAVGIAACVVWVLCGLYAIRFVDRGWIPHDEGTIGQSAVRVIAGQLPHRDFDEVYTGGLTYLNALGMQMFGTTLRSPRWVLFGGFMLFLAAVYAIARRVASSQAGIVAMVLVTVWSVPNYFVSLPSWYNLFLATFGVLALLRFLDTNQRRWLMLAGVAGGVSVLMKIAGVYYLAGGLLFLMYIEQLRSTTSVEQIRGVTSREGSGPRSRFWIVIAVPGAAFLLLLLQIFLSGSASPEFLQILVPALLVYLFVIARECSTGTGPVMERLRQLITIAWPFALGAAIPIVGFVLVFWQQGAVADLVRGVFILPQRRLLEARMDPPPIGALLLTAPYVALLLAGRWRRLPAEPLVTALVAAALALLLVVGAHPLAYRLIWGLTRALPAVVVATGLWILLRARSVSDHDSTADAPAFLLVTMAAMVALVQFPYATATYFCYAAPMTVLAILSLVATRPYAPVRLHVVVAAFFFTFAVVFMNRAYPWDLGFSYVRYDPKSRLDLARGGLLVPDEDKRTYEALTALLQLRVREGTIYAGPDCPEVYFLANLPNPTRTIFEFLTPVNEDRQWLTDLLERTPIQAVVINTKPQFSPRFTPNILGVLEDRFPYVVAVGQFTVRFAHPVAE